MAQDHRECTQRAAQGYALQVEAGATVVEVAAGSQGLWWYADYTTANAEEVAAADTIVDEERALVRRTCPGSTSLLWPMLCSLGWVLTCTA